MDDLLSDIHAFCASNGVSVTRFGLLALNDKPFVSQIAAGRRVWPETEARVRQFMAAFEVEASQGAAVRRQADRTATGTQGAA